MRSREPYGTYRTRFCTAVVCQTFSSESLIYSVASVQSCLNKGHHRSNPGADVSLQKRENDANNRAQSESKAKPLEASNLAV
jgi:NADH:ubiquinone oxidoreductase subunit E